MNSGLDFDFEVFAVNAIKSIDELRSLGPKQAQEPVESRINAFYRAIGLPSVVNIKTNKRIQPTNTGNTFEDKLDYQSSYNGSTYQFIFAQRNTKVEVLPDEYKKLLYFKQQKPSNSLGVGKLKRKRGVLFPCVVDGDLEVFPQTKRVAAPFTKEDDLDIGSGKDKYIRPLIESIIYIRLKGLGLSNWQKQEDVVKNFNDFFKLSGEEGISQDSTWLVAQVASAFRKAIITSVVRFEDAIREASSLPKNVGDTYKLLEGNICEQNPKKSGEKIEDGALDVVDVYLKEKEKTKQSFLSLLEFNDNNNSDKKNVVESVLLSHVISVLSSKEIKKESDEITNARKKNKGLERVKRTIKTLDLFTGEFSGISGVDILVVIAALFEISMEDLLGLLNDQAVENLKEIKKDVKDAVDLLEKRTPNVIDALSALENKIASIYYGIDAELQKNKIIDKKSSQEEGAK